MRWHRLHPQKVTDLDTFRQVLLENRGLKGQAAKSFFMPTSPLDLSLKEVGLSASKVTAAITLLQKHRDKKILVFGDYDADGICATAVMWLTLHSLGYQVMPFIPHRTQHGYGISHKALDTILAGDQPDLIISVDNGIVAHAPVERLRQAGIEVIITDHHQPETKLPPASAIVHTTQLCGTTVAWMLAREILRATETKTKADQTAQSLLDLCGLATIADQVPLLAANRSFAIAGVQVLQTALRPGIKALCLAADTAPTEITAETVNYTLAPRINAMGRLDHGLDALRLLCTGKFETATKLAAILNTTNLKRQGLTEAMLREAEQQAESFQDQHIIIVASENYHEGVIGLIAGRLTEKYTKPAIAISMGPVTSKASARSIMGINVVELIRQVREDLLEVGGHPMAAGFGLETEKIDVVRQRLQILAKTQIKVEMLEPTLRIDCELDFCLLSPKLAQLIQAFEPFGSANPKPLIQLSNVTVLELQPIGKQLQHLKLSLTDDLQDTTITALAWNMAQELSGLKPMSKSDVAATVELSTWNHRVELQLIIKAVTINPLLEL